jgi:hypothetical protein
VDIIFSDLDGIPLPPDEVRIRALRVDPLPNGRLVRVYLEVDPFQKRPNADLTISDDDGREVASTSIIESMDRNIEIRIHVPGAIREREYSLKAILFYAEFESESNSETVIKPFERRVVDTAETLFTIPLDS